MRPPARLRRTLLLTPGHRAERLAKAVTLDADSVAFDLEDGVPPGRRDEARAVVAEALRSLEFGRRERVARVNAVGTDALEADLLALPLAHLDTLLVPKVETPEALHRLDARLDELERDAGRDTPLALIVTLETPRGVLRALPIADASPRCAALFFGPGDYTAQTGGALTAEALAFPRATIAAAAGAVGCQAIDAPFFLDLHDAGAAATDARIARDLGFSGKMVFHPAQIAAVNAVFTPTGPEAARAARIVAAFRAAAEAGEAVALVDGEFIAPDLVPRQDRILHAARILGTLP